MLTSANDAATAVAEYTSGDSNKFVDLMNTTAAKLGMGNTHFANPTGLLDDNQYTTAEDISKLIRYAIRNAKFNRIFTARAKPWSSGDSTTEVLTSPNKLFYSYNGVEGGKTGYNKKEQQTAITTAYRDGMRLICIVLDSPEKDLFSSSAALFDYGYGEFRKSTLVHKGDILKAAEYQGNKINLISQNDVNYVHPIGESYIQAFQATSDLKPPVLKTVPAGNASYVLQDGTVINVTLYPATGITQTESFWTKARKTMLENKDILVLVLFLLAIECILVIINLFKLFKKWFSSGTKHSSGSGQP
jgi:D-alanyl-D-alanine carboxypeptidase/D-alanyl-D-alanine carboxypeptidase (penicillin-binding protein 5/6)